MKILYLTKGDHVDYQNDCLLIGLKEMFGTDVVDYNKQHHNYISFDEQKAKKMYGMGMSVTRVLPDLEVDRTDITSKIKSKYFDYIVYGSIWRCNDQLKKILEYYPANKVIAVDGEDETRLHPCVNLNLLYFKRELVFSKKNVFPISFSIPTNKVEFVKTNKTRNQAICDPRNKSTYIYSNEKDYYCGYKESRFGITMAKAGWDCMRHYEILANGCIPYFINLHKCPNLTMTSFPKELCLAVEKEIQQGVCYERVYENYINKFEVHLLKNNTTKAEAVKFLNTIKLCQQ
jgi:hypothetical protein